MFGMSLVQLILVKKLIYVLGMLYLCTFVGRAGQVSTHETEMGDSSYSSIGMPPLSLR